MRFSLILLWLFQIPPPFADMPSDPGIYFRQPDGQWLNLQLVSLSDTKTKGLKSYIETGGFSKFETDFSLRGPRAKIRTKLRKPVFYLRGLASPQSVMLLQLEQKREIRVVHASPLEATIDNKGGFKKKAIRKINWVEYSDRSFSVAPQRLLKPGEYLLTLGQEASGCDFGVDK